MTTLERWQRRMGDLAGRALWPAVWAGARMRRGKAIHRAGVVHRGVLTILATGELGVPLLDNVGESPVICRISQAVASRPRSRQIFGVALRLKPDSDPADLMFATAEPDTRRPLRLRRRATAWDGPATSLVPFRTVRGKVLLGAFPSGTDSFHLRWASPSGQWRQIGVIALQPASNDTDVHFDPAQLPAGLSYPTWLTALRRHAYAASRAGASG